MSAYAGLPNKMRPSKLSEVIGQGHAVESLKGMAKSGFPHFIMFTGPSGCGKTTLARIIANRLGCTPENLEEINAASDRGIDLVRRIESHVGYNPIGGGESRVWLIDECHQLSGDAQGGFLKVLEDPPSHAYFIFCTTDPQKLRQTIRTRATIIELKAVKIADLKQVILRALDAEVCIDENGNEHIPEVSDDVIDKIAEYADGSPRKALVLLGQVLGIVGEDEQMKALQATLPSKDAIEIPRTLLKRGSQFADVLSVIKSIQDMDEQAEKIRWLVLSYMTKVALTGGKDVARAMQIIDAFRDNYYDTKGAGLILSCHQCYV